MHSIRQRIYTPDDRKSKIKKTILTHIWFNLIKILLPPMGFVFSAQLIGHMVKTPTTFDLSAIHYVIAVTIVLLFLIAIIQRKNIHEYKSIYRESIQCGIRLKCRLNNFSLPASSKQLSHKESEIITTDIALYEDALRHYLPQLYATIISTLFITLILLIHNPKPGLATLWAIPLALCVFAYSGKRENRYDRNINTESVSHIGMGITTIILKLGMVSVALIGANMLVTDQIGILDYIAFLTVSASLSFPIPRLMRLSNLLSRFNKYLQEAEF